MTLHKSLAIKSGLIFIVAAILVAVTYPNRVKFMYVYNIGQPWRYKGVLTAPYDFPVYKSDAERVAERDSIERSKLSYYTFDLDVRLTQRNRLTSDFSEGKFPKEVTSRSVQYALSILDYVYEQGILSNQDYEKVLNSETDDLYLVDELNVAKRRELKDIYTARSAYEYLLKERPKDLSESLLQSINFENYLISNLRLDNQKTEQMHNARLATITDVVGQVQKGERIVGTGDLVTPEIYQELEGYRKAFEETSGSKTESLLIFVGQLILILLIFGIIYTYLISFRPDLLRQTKNTVFIVLSVSILVILAFFLVPIEPSVSYMIPYSMVAILLRIFFDSRTSSIIHISTVLMASLVMPSPLEFIVIQIIAGRIVLVTLRNLSQRSDLVRTSFFVYFGMVIVYLAFVMAYEGQVSRINWYVPFYMAINFIFLMFTYVLVYVVERIFGYVSNISLVELSDINKPLLRQLSEVAPGTFQHSLNVSILASEAVDEIGGDVRLVRSGALYHDIGKMKNPTYFTENQGSTNPHDRLTYDQSAKIIIRHVSDGIEMAEKAKLPKQVIDFIRTHHGLGLTKYFYIKYKNEHPDEIIDESIFHYPGPNPFTKEQGVLMLADAVEASSRSLKELTEQKIIDHINKIVDGIVEDGYLKDTPLTFRDIETIKFVFNDKLRNMYHSRIDYPELKRNSLEVKSEANPDEA